MKRWKKRAIAAGIAVALCILGLTVPTQSLAAKVNKVTLNKTEVTLYKGADKSKSSVTLKASVKPAGKIKWTSIAQVWDTYAARLWGLQQILFLILGWENYMVSRALSVQR